MKIGIYVIRDKAAQMYSTPFFQTTDVHAVRQIQQEVQRADPANVLHTHSSDFTLEKIGEFDTEAGTINSIPETTMCNLDVLKIKNTKEAA